MINKILISICAPRYSSNSIKRQMDFTYYRKALDRGGNFAIFRPLHFKEYIAMAKKNIVLVKLESTAGTGFFYVKKRNPRKQTEKLKFRKFDPVVRKHVEFVETKLKS